MRAKLVLLCVGLIQERSHLRVTSVIPGSLRSTCWPIISDHTQVRAGDFGPFNPVSVKKKRFYEVGLEACTQ